MGQCLSRRRQASRSDDDDEEEEVCELVTRQTAAARLRKPGSPTTPRASSQQTRDALLRALQQMEHMEPLEARSPKADPRHRRAGLDGRSLHDANSEGGDRVSIADDKMESQLQKCYNLVIELTRRAGKLVRCHFKKPKNVQTKFGVIDFVTETDRQVERLLVTSLLRNFPDHKYIGEESVAEGQKCHLTDDPTWIIDPVDGTMNFVHNNPTFCISVALWITKKPHIGVIYNPVLDLMFTARRGKGAFLNGNRIAASSTTDVEKALIAYEIGSILDTAYMQVTLANIETLIKKIHGLRVSGCPTWDMASVAMGGIDCHFEFGLHMWDMAAGVLLVQEAGGFVCDPCGGKLDPFSRRVLCTGTEELAQKIIPLIKQYHPKQDDN